MGGERACVGWANPPLGSDVERPRRGHAGPMNRFLDRLGRFLDLLEDLTHAAAVLILVVAGVAYLLLH